MVRVFAIVFIVSLLLLAYPIWRLGDWLQIPASTNLIITTPLFLSQFIARFALRHRRGKAAYIIRRVADFYLGLSPIILIQVLLAEICLALFDWPSTDAALFILASTALAGILGLANAWHPATVVVELSSKKLNRPVRFAQISDVHIGSRTPRFLQRIVDDINRHKPEFLCITGDFIDQSGITLEALEPLRSFTGPIYYCTGNHERYEDLDEIVERLKVLGVEVLRNRSLVHGGLQFVGIDDCDDPGQVAKVLPCLDIRDDLYSILLYHRPRGLEAAQHHGIDLKLSGHTHNGQIMPFHLAVNRAYQYTKGLYQYNGTYLYVNEGTGTWGPTLRLGTRSEITLFELSPSPPEN